MLAEMKDQMKAGQSESESMWQNLITFEEVGDERKAQNAKLAEQMKELMSRHGRR